ncbi:MAG: nucleotidyltransferase domain-containing protein [Selenomonadaceae bacterium]|nr:nucleotidyltransferase domain-containing protein [Selenomonadaceae bacterium]
MLTLEEIREKVIPIAKKYKVEKISLFGSYARGEANKKSDLDFLVFGGKNFKPTLIFSLAEDLREIFNKEVDVFEISELKQDSDFFKKIMQEKVLVA